MGSLGYRALDEVRVVMLRGRRLWLAYCRFLQDRTAFLKRVESCVALSQVRTRAYVPPHIIAVVLEEPRTLRLHGVSMHRRTCIARTTAASSASRR